jgi:threonine/homoserine/homoserine lactone efflux protein
MEPSSILLFAAALFVAAAAPGPTVAAILARVLGRGRPGALAFTAGIAIGDVVWLTIAVTGLAMLAEAFHGIFLAIRWLGVAYLLWLAWKLWHAPARPLALGPSPDAERPLRLFLGGLSVTLGNPKVMIFYLALLPGLVDLGHLRLLGYLELVAVILAVLTIVLGGYVVLALRARRLLASERSLRLVQRGTGTVMAGAALAIAVH